MNLVSSLVFVGLVTLLWQCTGFQGKYSDPMEENMIDDQFNEVDLKLIADSAIKSCLARPWLRVFQQTHNRRPIVGVDTVENRTDEHIDMSTITEQLRSALINSGKIRFINIKKRGKLKDELTYQKESGAVSRATQKKRGRQIALDFFLGGSMSSQTHMRDGVKSISYTYEFTLTNLETSEVVWSHYGKPIYKRFKSSRYKM